MLCESGVTPMDLLRNVTNNIIINNNTFYLFVIHPTPNMGGYVLHKLQFPDQPEGFTQSTWQSRLEATSVCTTVAGMIHTWLIQVGSQLLHQLKLGKCSSSCYCHMLMWEQWSFEVPPQNYTEWKRQERKGQLAVYIQLLCASLTALSCQSHFLDLISTSSP